MPPKNFYCAYCGQSFSSVSQLTRAGLCTRHPDGPVRGKHKLYDNESYYKNFAPSFLEMQQHAEEMQEAVDRIREQTARLHDYGERLRKHFDIKDVVKDMAI